MRKNILYFNIIFLILFSQKSYSDAWLQKKYHGIIITSIETKQFNSTNPNGSFNDTNKVYQNLFILYGEYGITNRITLGAKIIALDNFLLNGKNIFKDKVEQRHFGLDTSLLFWRLGIITKNKYITLSIVGQFGFPSVEHNRPQISYFSIKKYSYEPRLEIGIKFNKYNIMTITGGYHGYINHWYDEVRTEIMYGHYFSDSILLMAKFQKFFYVIKSSKTAQTTYVNLNTSVFDFLANTGFAKFTLSLATSITKNTTLEFGAYTSIRSKLIKTKNLHLKMYGFYISCWFKF